MMLIKLFIFFLLLLILPDWYIYRAYIHRVSQKWIRRAYWIPYNPQNEMFRLLGTKRSFSQNETFFFSHPYPALFRLISHF